VLEFVAVQTRGGAFDRGIALRDACAKGGLSSGYIYLYEEFADGRGTPGLVCLSLGPSLMRFDYIV
jgi:hypothetical protein